jgi:NADH-quinone oxidoreductase subunit H
VVIVVCAFALVAGYLSLLERKLLADFQVRMGPMRVGPFGLLQPIADAVKVLQKEDIIINQADKAIFWLAPVIPNVMALLAFSVIPFSGKYFMAADVNVALLVISATSAVGVLGVILGGWSSNSHYSLLGALRGGAQLISMKLRSRRVSGVMAAGTMSMGGIVNRQLDSHVWFAFENYGE